MTELTGKVGFASPVSEKILLRRTVIRAELIAIAALAVCLVVALTAVSIGVARAQAFDSFARHDRALLSHNNRRRGELCQFRIRKRPIARKFADTGRLFVPTGRPDRYAAKGRKLTRLLDTEFKVQGGM